MSTSGMSAKSRATDLRGRLGSFARGRAARTGRPPRAAYEHYFIESEGIHSRIHLQNYWSTFWPQVDEPAIAHIRAYDADGAFLGQVDRELGRFSSLFLEIEDLLRELGAEAEEGTVAVDLEPPEGVRGQFDDLPQPEAIEVKTPFWMAYHDADENYMYVHSIELLHGETFGAPRLLARSLDAEVPIGASWRSWRLLEVDRLSELQIVAINHSPERRSSTVRVHPASGEASLWEQSFEFEPRALHRARVPAEVLADWRDRVGELPLVRVGLDPLLTGNGKPYVLLRYADGPLSLHHG
jgi:hypothetical protein